ncbi:hypothetical protein H0H93_015845 [Arthromyces matolae]|nr:hypothetical protein H0H93_015845 [Arthromyces matolae]
MGVACSRTSGDDHQELIVRLQHGIMGGFSGPNPDEIHTITKQAHSSSLLIQSLTRSSSSMPLMPCSPKHLPIDKDDSSPARLLTELRVILAQLPTEKPAGSEDIFGEDTGLTWSSEDFTWWNGGPDGCGGGGKSRVQPTEKQKEKFKRAVEIIYELVDRAV